MNTEPAAPKRTKTLTGELVDALTAQIRERVYAPGEKLPTEPEVMKSFGVSRTVVREAMSRLQALGLVEMRHGVGAFVLSPVDAQVGQLSTVETIRDVIAMLELRISLETEAAGLAALRRSAAHLEKMRAALDAFDVEAEKGGASIDADFEFHLQIALSTGNKYFEEFYRYLGKHTTPRARLNTAQYAPEPGGYLARTNREHEAIFEAIARQDPQAASAGMRMHLSNSRERLKRASL